jgi:hypothetical protein
VRLRFIAPGHEGAVCAVFGQAFPHGEWVDVSGLDPEHVDRLAQNPTFEAEPEPASDQTPVTSDAAAPARSRRRA